MRVKTKLISAVVAFAIIVTLSSSALTTSAVADTSTAERDYTKAPYYYALVEWFDYFDYSEGQREQFMADTETLDNILYSDEYWNYGDYSFADSSNDENNGISLHTVKYPLTGYGNGDYFSNPVRGVGCPPCTHHSSGCSLDGNCGCRSVNWGIQCYGFANFLHWIYNGSYFDISTQKQGLSSSNWSVNNIKIFFTDKVSTGSHVRLHCKGKTYFHSYTVLEKSSTGIKIYDANWDGQCGIRITDVTWSQIYSYFDYIDYIIY